MPSSNRVFLLLFPLLILCISPLSAYGQGLVITDCQGFTRAARNAEAGTSNRVEVGVEAAAGAPAEEIQVTLTNTATQETQRTVAHAGVATFENVPPGVFEVAVVNSNINLTVVTISGMTFTTLATTSAVVGTALVGGGAAVGAGIAIEEETNGKDSKGAPPTPMPTPRPPDPTPTISPPPDCGGCDPDATPQPIDPFAPVHEGQALSPAR